MAKARRMPIRAHALEWGWSMDGDSLYFSRRGSEERRAAAAAVDPRARQAHLELADRYEELATAIGSHERAGLAGAG
jgi:hypothetical protein